MSLKSWIIAPPFASAPKKSAASSTPKGVFRPSRATAIPVKPYPGEKRSMNR
jgi:hypothetical protein